MASAVVTASPSTLVTRSRQVLAFLAGTFLVGVVLQVFLAGLGLFDDADRWGDHETFGHILGLVTYVLWIPAVLGRGGIRLIGGAVLLFVLYFLQYAFVGSDEPAVKALHPVNALALFSVAAWVGLRSLALLRRT
jgi:hypothetical protein